MALAASKPKMDTGAPEAFTAQPVVSRRFSSLRQILSASPNHHLRASLFRRTLYPHSTHPSSHLSTNKLSSLRSRLTKVCIAITGDDPAEAIDRARQALAETTFLEFRLDYFAHPAAAIAPLREFLIEHPTVTAIATCRRTQDGGHFRGKLVDELAILTTAAQAGFRIVDLPIDSAEAAKPADLDHLRSTGVALLLSHHDFSATGDLEAVLARALRFTPDFIKIVPTAQTLSDNLTLIRFLEKNADTTNLVGICMGDAGVISRVLGVRAGSVFTFASASVGVETAPGQIDARTLLDTYRLDEVDAATKVYGVAGNPVRHSLSPLMLNTAFRREKLNAAYLALPADSIDDLLKLAHGIPLQGLSITMPLKQTILPYLEHTDPLTAKIGACNTVLRAPDGKLYGFNTDVAGIVMPLTKRLGNLRDAKILVLGAGGAARAAVFGLRDKGADVSILNRTSETAQKLARKAGAKSITRDALRKSSFDVIVNATPVGMAGHEAASPLTEDELRAKLVFDLIYNPIETPLLRLARQAGIPVISGVEMFVQQGARQFEIWTGRPAPEEEMLRVVLHTLRNRAESATLINETPAAPTGDAAPRSAETAIAAAPDAAESIPVPQRAATSAANQRPSRRA